MLELARKQRSVAIMHQTWLRRIKQRLDYQENPRIGINDCLLKYGLTGGAYKFSQLALPWQLHEQVAEGHPQCRDDKERIRNCTVAISGVPRELGEADLFRHVITLNGELPVGNHECLATHLPIKLSQLTSFDGDKLDFAYVRWSSPEFATRCIDVINNELAWFDNNQIGKPDKLPIRAFETGNTTMGPGIR